MMKKSNPYELNAPNYKSNPFFISVSKVLSSSKNIPSMFRNPEIVSVSGRKKAIRVERMYHNKKATRSRLVYQR